MQQYYKLRDGMKTGDVIGFSGNGRVSKIIKWKTGSPFSHVGIIMDTQVDGGIGRAVLMMESAANCPLADDVSGKIINGVQVHFLSSKLESYDGKAWWLPLKEPLPHYAEFSMQAWLRQERAKAVPYDTIGAIGAGIDFFDCFPGIQREPDLSALFCSELVTKALQVAGVVDDAINPSEQTPADVTNFPCFGGAVEVK